MSNSGRSDDDATKVIYNKTDRTNETLMVPGRVGGQQGDQTVFVPGHPTGHPGGAATEAAFNPVVGWLVVVDGPGRGHFRPIFYGQSSIGRGDDMRIAIDFGDQRISREAHAFLVYDEVERKFFVRDNGKSTIVRLNGNAVLTHAELHDRDRISIGETTLLFVALCDQNFDWLAGNAAKTA